MQFEICVTSLASTQAAFRAGAHRVELCSALDNGGVTPSAGLIRACVEQGGLPVHVLIRPREGHFRYDEREIAVMLADIAFCREAGAAGEKYCGYTFSAQVNRQSELLASARAIRGNSIATIYS